MVGQDMSDVLTLPVLPLDDAVVLPGMVVPVRLDDSDTRAAVDAATAAAQDRDDGRRVLVVPRIDGRYGAIGVVAVLDPRLATAHYGSFLKASLPPMWTTTDPAVVRQALTRLAASAG